MQPAHLTFTVDFGLGTGGYNLSSYGFQDAFILKLNSELVNAYGSISKIGLKVYPNPFTNRLIIESGKDIPNGLYRIIDINGKTIWESNTIANQVVTPDLRVAPGIYFLILESGNERIKVKLMKF